MTRWTTVVGVCLVGGLFSASAAAETERYAIVGALVLVGDGTSIEDATVVIRGDRIESVQTGGPVPSGAARIDVEHAVVTPGLWAVGSALGLVEISAEDSTTHESPSGGEEDPVRAAFTAADGLNPRSTLIPVARLGGVTTALATPQGGLIAGTSSLFDLAGERPADLMRQPLAALHVDLDDGGVAAAGGAMPAALGRLREVLADARLYAERRALYDRRGLRDLSVSGADLERLGLALARRFPLVVRVARADNILRVLLLAREQGLDLILYGADEGWRVADAIARDEVPVIVEPLSNLPRSFSRLGARLDNAALLREAGVDVIIGSRDAHGLSALRQEAGNAVAHGMSPADALSSLTSVPANAFGVGGEYGTVEAGKAASVVVWNGDPFETTSYATHVFVRGQPMPMRSRQTDLFERYRDLSRLGLPPATTGP